MLKILRKEKSYQKLLMAGVINGVGDRFSQVALLSLLLQMTGSGLSVGITLALRLIPFLLFGPFSSKLADRIGRKQLLIYTDMIRAIVAISFLWITNPEDLWIAYVGSFLLASGEALYAPTRKASIPAIVDNKNLKGINSWEQVLLGFVLIIGAFCGGIVAFLFGAKAAFLVNVLSFIVAAFILSGIPSLEAKSFEKRLANNLVVKNQRFLPLVVSSPILMMLVAFEVAIPIINGIENVLLSVYAVKTFHAEDLGVGILYSVLGFGFVVSPLITKHIHSRFLPIGYLCIVMEGVILSLISQTGSFSLVVALFGILTIFGGVGNTLLDTAAMETIPAKWHGLYFSITATIANTCLGISMFVSGLFLEIFSPRSMGLTGGLLYMGVGFLFFVYSLGFNLVQERQKLAKKAES